MKTTEQRQGRENIPCKAAPYKSFGRTAIKLRKFFVIFGLLCALLVMSACSSTADTAAFSGGSGTEEDPYLISTPEDLWEVAERINTKETHNEYAAAFYRLTADIDLGGKKEWVPIGYYAENAGSFRFEGTFDGGGHTVQGIRVDYKDPLLGQNQTDFGLFGRLEGTVKDLTISDSSIAADGESSINVGAVAGEVRNSVLTNCHTTDSVTVSGSYYAGGLCGGANQSSALSNCSNAASVASTGTVGCAGGITAYASCHIEACINSGSVEAYQGDAAGIAVTASNGVADCENTGDVSAEDYAAGIVCSFDDGALNSGMNDASVMLLRCTNAGNISSEKDTAGGIAVSCRTGSIADCRNTGSVTSPKETGGILAYFQPGVFGTPCEIFTVSGCENSGAVSSTGNYAAGGICGMIYGEETRLVFENCVNSGSVEAAGLTDVLVSSAKAGGIIGTGSVSALEVRSCRNSGSVRGYAVSGGILGEASPVQGAEAASLLVQSCTNSGSIYTVFPGGLAQEIYAGGIVGCCPIALPDENLLPLFDDLRIENCENTGKLDGDREPDILCTDDLCGSWQSRLS